VLPWWGWLLLWTALATVSVVWLGAGVRDVWRRAGALAAEVSRVGDLVASLEARAEEPSEVEAPAVAATRHPVEVLAEFREERRRNLADRRSRRAARMPPWARVD
jgi:hypothetical protein